MPAKPAREGHLLVHTGNLEEHCKDHAPTVGYLGLCLRGGKNGIFWGGKREKCELSIPRGQDRCKGGRVPPFAPPPKYAPYLRSLYTYCSNSVEPLYEGQVGVGSFVPWREVVLFSEVTNVLIAMEVLFSEAPLFLGERLSSSRRL